MSKDLSYYQYQYYQLLENQNFDYDSLDYSLLDNHYPFLHQLDAITNSCVSIFDLHKKSHIYLSNKFQTILGLDNAEAHEMGNAYFDNRIHPDDLLHSVKTGVHYLKLMLEFTHEQRSSVKLINDYRIRNGKEEYVRVIEQFQALEFDKNGNVWLVLCIMDISPDQNLDSEFRSRMLNFKTGEMYTIKEEPAPEQPQLSKREIEVLGLISNGFVSKQIADQLFISLHTVNTHRQRIIEKLKVSNTFEAIRYAQKYGLL